MVSDIRESEKDLNVLFVMAWFIEGFSQHLRTLIGHTGGVWCAQFSGSTIVSGSTDRTLKVRIEEWMNFWLVLNFWGFRCGILTPVLVCIRYMVIHQLFGVWQ
jgi:WD40 repeat protein